MMKAQIVSFHCVLKNKLGQVLSSSFNQDVINQLEQSPENGAGQNLRGLIAGIQNVHRGEKREIEVSAHDAFGYYNPSLLISVPRSEVCTRGPVAIGDKVLRANGKRKRNASAMYRVVQIKGDMLVLDGNHPLAGQDLVFNIEVVSARDAEPEDFVSSECVKEKPTLH